MPPQFTYSPRKFIQGRQSSRIQPYATHPIRYTEYVPYFDTMNEQASSIDGGIGEVGGRMKGRRGRGRKGRNKMGKQGYQQEQQSDIGNMQKISNGEPMTQGLMGDPSLDAWQPPQETPSPMVQNHVGSNAWEMKSYTGQKQASEGQSYPQTYPSFSPPAIFPSPPYQPSSSIAQDWASSGQPFNYQTWMNYGYGLPQMSLPHYTTAPAPAIALDQPHFEKFQPSFSINEELNKLRLTTAYLSSPSQSLNNQPTALKPQGSLFKDRLKPKSHDPNQRRSISDITILDEKAKRRLNMGEKPSFHPKGPEIQGKYREDQAIELPSPKPSKEYLAAAGKPTKLLSNPSKSKLLIILDLNGTLLCRGVLPNGRRDKFNPYPRRNIGPFIDYIFKHHQVAVFSSAMAGTILNLLKTIIPLEHRSKILRIFTREDMDIPARYFRAKVSTFKRLTTVWESLELQHNDWKYDQTNTILIDDTSAKAATEPHNLLMLPEYTLDLHFTGMDDALGNAVGYLEEVRKWDNVSSYMKTQPFDVDTHYTKPEGWYDSHRIELPATSHRPRKHIGY
ncbi:hypothetical protein ABW20_dc0105731 [Dactylellina cionopaga]|nr:hypothetical protein ABW20_dc0105731 [Dactylellina cionopaga]